MFLIISKNEKHFCTNFRCLSVTAAILAIWALRNDNFHDTILPACQWRGETRAERARRENAIRASGVENSDIVLYNPSATGALWLYLLIFFFFVYTEQG